MNSDNPTKKSRNRFPSYKIVRYHLRDERAPLGRETHGEMDRFLREVTDGARSGGPEWGGSSHLAPHPLSREGAERVEDIQLLAF